MQFFLQTKKPIDAGETVTELTQSATPFNRLPNGWENNSGQCNSIKPKLYRYHLL
jgi:hypothetical protein